MRVLPRPLAAIRLFALLGLASHAAFADPPRPPATASVEEFAARIRPLPSAELPPEALGVVWESGPKTLTRDEAAGDTRAFFALLSHTWCGYGYFREIESPDGGNGNPFDTAESAVLEALASREAWPTRDLPELLRAQLAFVRDCHLSVGAYGKARLNFCRHQDFWFDPGLTLRREGEGAVLEEGGSRLPVLSIDGDDPAPHLFPSLDENGEASLLLGALADAPPPPRLVRVGGADGERTLRRTLTRSTPRPRARFGEERVGGVPVVRLRSCADYFARELEELVDHAPRYRGEPYLVLDIRGNGGGNTRWPRAWITAFTGERPVLKQALSELISGTTMSGRANIFEMMTRNYRAKERQAAETELEHYRAVAASFGGDKQQPYWSTLYVPHVEPIANPTTLIVLVDRRVASAGEGVVSFLRDQVENVVLVGENTRGALTFGQLAVYQLPHSKLLVQVPIKLNIALDLAMREERGFEPDYWVPAPHALNRAVAAARAGTLETAVPLPKDYFESEFVREAVPPAWLPSRKERVRGLITLLLALVPALINWKRGWRFFVVAGVVAVAVGAGLLAFRPWMSAALGFVACVYFAVAAIKAGRAAARTRPANQEASR